MEKVPLVVDEVSAAAKNQPRRQATAMGIINWNIRGLGKDRTFREAQEVIREHRPQILLFSKTKMTTPQMRKNYEQLCFPGCFVVGREWIIGGLATLWSSEVTVEVKSYSLHHIDVVVHSEKGRL